MTTKTGNLKFLSALTRGVASDTFEALDCPTSLGLYLCLQAGDDVAACTHEIDPLAYEDKEDFANCYAAASLLSKFASVSSSHKAELREVALTKFWLCETRLKDAYPKFKNALFRDTPVVSEILSLAREKVAQILGPIGEAFDIDDCNFGPGSSSSIPRRRAHPSNKFVSVDASSGCAPLVSMFFQDAGFPRPVLNVVEHSRIEFVPKNFKTDRVIAIEPDWNIFFQKGVGKAIRRRLQKIGLDLNHGGEKHNHLARQASVDASLATVDLSSASDSISTTLVRFLLPDDWFNVMNSIRTDRISIERTVHPLRKFSSMGNGFTFELETLVFYALAKATCIVNGARGTVSVFGDDIILPNGVVPCLTTVFETCGLVLNKAKSFSAGYFRESCGAHYFGGRDVKPYFLKKDLSNDAEKFRCCNALRELAHRLYGCDVFDTPLFQPYTRCFNAIRRVFYIPAGCGDGGIVSTFDEACPPAINPAGRRVRDRSIRRHPNCIEGYKVRCLLPIAVKAQSDHRGMLLHKLRSAMLQRRSVWHTMGERIARISARDLRIADVEPTLGNEYSTASQETRYRVGFINVARWTNPGEV